MSIDALALVNGSTLVTAIEADAIALAVSAQIRDDFGPVWNVPAIPVLLYSSLEKVPTDGSTFVLHLVDTQDLSGTYGYHTPFYAEVECKPILDAGNGVLSGSIYTVSSVVSHEAMEALGNIDVNLWIRMGSGPEVAFELADPVEANGYLINGVLVSDFVTPAWFGIGNGPVDKLGAITAPFEIARGGYTVQRSSESGTPQEVYGAMPPPQWRLDMSKRLAKRLVQ